MAKPKETTGKAKIAGATKMAASKTPGSKSDPLPGRRPSKAFTTALEAVERIGKLRVYLTK